MNKEAATIQEECQWCQLSVDKEESYVVFVTEDWRTPFMEYMAQGILPTDKKFAHQLRKLAIRYFLQNGILFKRGYSGDPLRCLGPREAKDYWPIMKTDSEEMVKTYHACQVLGDAIHTHPNVLQDMMTPWPFHTWEIDLIGPINPSSNGHIWILAATEYFKK